MPASTAITGPLRRLRRRILLHRRGLAAAFAGLTVYAVIASTQQPPPQTTPAWTAARDLPSGVRLTNSDLVRREFLPDSLPAQAFSDPSELTGRVLASPAGRGEVITPARLVGRDLGNSYPGKQIVPVRLGDEAVAELFKVGDPITILAADPNAEAAAVTLTDEAVVAGLPKAGSSNSFESAGRLILAAVPDSQAARVASASATQFLIALWSAD
ncbi:MAG TPA: SAF domain-containing protein [Marmoricola sp.]|nr:SAF domain-containing protein [Marmoricola sp.]HMY08623.1 SAF domain-containing protein [Marmoricola sp.]